MLAVEVRSSDTADAAARELDRAGAVLTIDLDAIVANHRLLRARFTGAHCAAVVKADAYGLGAARVAPALAAAGCWQFFVAHLDEGIALRPHLPAGAEIFVLHGPPPGTERDVTAHHLTPVLNSLEQIAGWHAAARRAGRPLPAVVQVDTGMARLGLSAAELDRITDDPSLLDGVALRAVMSHLASAEDQGNPANAAQLARFRDARRRLPPAPGSFANSSGIFLGVEFHADLARPGAALYGVAPVAGAANPMRPVVRLQGRVIQLRDVPAGTAVGYGGAFTTERPTRIATVSVGYADGFLRSLGNRGAAHLDGVALPILGRVSMDTITLDATAVPEGLIGHGTAVDLIGPHQTVDDVAALAGTIGYEILTSLGRRYARRYLSTEGLPA
ncbi:alanine racemase [Azospirillum sp. RWY-5-1]|uniref:Alanine racemase n=1 Tax=Azospirillum oleiclasticum TaxID=2735135 RepID=A0ABX2T6M8_9PROT|nr:alanine racemase [Azospirillum oleiclasticum]NYZ19846.1 alanine racemase [Azospirillum oleiclasticum]